MKGSSHPLRSLFPTLLISTLSLEEILHVLLGFQQERADRRRLEFLVQLDELEETRVGDHPILPSELLSLHGDADVQ